MSDWKNKFDIFRDNLKYMSLETWELEEEEFRWMCNKLDGYEKIIKGKWEDDRNK